MATNTSSTNLKDTRLLSGANANTNFGTNTIITLDNSAGRVSIISFQLASGSGTISKISLFLYGSGSISGKTMNVHQLSAHTDWGETTATWNKYDGTNNWTTPGGDYSATIIDTATIATSASWHELVLMGTGATNPLTLTWGDNVHLFLRSPDAGSDPDFNSKEAAGNKPYIEITYASGSIKSINGLAYASVKSKNGLAIANIKSINGLS